MGVRLDCENNTLNFWLNERPQPKRNLSITKGDFLLLIKMKNYGNTVILNPFANLGDKNISFPQKLLLSPQERNYLVNSKDNKLVEAPKTETVEDTNTEITEDNKTEAKEGSEEAGADEVPEEGKAQQI